MASLPPNDPDEIEYDCVTAVGRVTDELDAVIEIGRDVADALITTVTLPLSAWS
jgi:hypothetical protein